MRSCALRFLLFVAGWLSQLPAVAASAVVADEQRRAGTSSSTTISTTASTQTAAMMETNDSSRFKRFLMSSMAKKMSSKMSHKKKKSPKRLAKAKAKSAKATMKKKKKKSKKSVKPKFTKMMKTKTMMRTKKKEMMMVMKKIFFPKGKGRVRPGKGKRVNRLTSTPTVAPITLGPTAAPVLMTFPRTSGPTTLNPTASPSAKVIRRSPSPTTSPLSPISSTVEPTDVPSSGPSDGPSSLPTNQPTSEPTKSPTMAPSTRPSTTPTGMPSRMSSDVPSYSPSTSIAPTESCDAPEEQFQVSVLLQVETAPGLIQPSDLILLEEALRNAYNSVAGCDRPGTFINVTRVSIDINAVPSFGSNLATNETDIFAFVWQVNFEGVCRGCPAQKSLFDSNKTLADPSCTCGFPTIEAYVAECNNIIDQLIAEERLSPALEYESDIFVGGNGFVTGASPLSAGGSRPRRTTFTSTVTVSWLSSSVGDFDPALYSKVFLESYNALNALNPDICDSGARIVTSVVPTLLENRRRLQLPFSIVFTISGTCEGCESATVVFGDHIPGPLDESAKCPLGAVFRCPSEEEFAEALQDALDRQEEGLANAIESVSQEAPIDCSINSTFQDGGEGWVATGRISSFGWDSRGWLSARDSHPGPALKFQAPSKFLGNFSSSYGLSISYDLLTTLPSSVTELQLHGGGLILSKDTGPATGTFTTMTAILSEDDGWLSLPGGSTAQEQDIRTVLSNVTSLLIRGDLRAGFETVYLDNVFFQTACSPLEYSSR